MKNIKHLSLLAAVACGALTGNVPVAMGVEAAEQISAGPMDVKTGSASFQPIQERNIFDSYRHGPVKPGVAAPPVDYFTLSGTSSYENKSIAIFNGNDRQFRGTFMVGGSIAGYRIMKVNYDSIDLRAGTNQPITLPVLTQMRRVDGGPWNLTANPLPVSSGASSAAPSNLGPVDEVMRRMMERHSAEMNGK